MAKNGFSYLRQIARNIAECHQQDEAKKEGRYIYCKEQFTDKDREKIKAKADGIVNCLRNGNGRPWWDIFHIEEGKIIIDKKGVFSDITDIVSGLHIGFKTQDNIENACKKCGITFIRGGIKK